MAKHGYAMTSDIRWFAGVKRGPGSLYVAIPHLEERGFIAPPSDEGPRPSV